MITDTEKQILQIKKRTHLIKINTSVFKRSFKKLPKLQSNFVDIQWGIVNKLCFPRMNAKMFPIAVRDFPPIVTGNIGSGHIHIKMRRAYLIVVMSEPNHFVEISSTFPSAFISESIF